jgi:fumarylacetoacetase
MCPGLTGEIIARDIQSLEMMPLGPLNGKNFGTSISPWIVTLDALEAFRTEGAKHEEAIASYLADPQTGSYSVDLTVEIIAQGSKTVTCRSNLGKSLYWNFRQMLAHQTVGGCSLETGDLLASGTVSGESEDARGCLLETTSGGKNPVILQDGTSRTYLENGDTVRLTGLAGPGVGFGDCIGALKPARPWK